MMIDLLKKYTMTEGSYNNIFRAKRKVCKMLHSLVAYQIQINTPMNGSTNYGEAVCKINCGIKKWQPPKMLLNFVY